MSYELFDHLLNFNQPMPIHLVESRKFRAYGKLHQNLESAELLEDFPMEPFIPDSGNFYQPSDAAMESLGVVKEIAANIYGGLEIQAGPCCGYNTLLTGLEYHQGSEVIIALTDCVLFLGKVQDMQRCDYDGKLAEAFFIKKGQVVELYGTTLHYTPCRVDDNPFVTVVILLKGTNAPFGGSSSQLLTKKNKFFITHQSQKEKVAQGCYPGLAGDLRELKI